MNSAEPPASEQVVTAVAAYHGAGPMELTPPLGECIDTDALDKLLETPDVEVKFTYLGLRIRVSATTGVSILDEIRN